MGLLHYFLTAHQSRRFHHGKLLLVGYCSPVEKVEVLTKCELVFNIKGVEGAPLRFNGFVLGGKIFIHEAGVSGDFVDLFIASQLLFFKWV